MTDTPENLIETMQKQQLDLLKEQQSAVLTAVSGWNDTLRSLSATTGATAPVIPSSDTDATELLNGYFRFAEQVLSSHHEFALALLKDRIRTTVPPKS